MLQLIFYTNLIYLINYKLFFNYCFILLSILFIFEFKFNTINLNSWENSLSKNNNFIKESFYIDFLQKKFIDNFFKKTLIISSQIFNLNFFTIITVRYIHSFFTMNSTVFNKHYDSSISIILIYIIIFFYIIITILLNILLLL